MTLQSKLRRLATALTAISPSVNVYHYWRPQMTAPFIVWQEEEGEEFWTCNRMVEQTISGSIDFYTMTEFDPIVDDIQGALTALDVCGWSLESIQYEDETNLIHYSWSFNLG